MLLLQYFFTFKMNSQNENKIFVKKDYIEKIFSKYEELLMLKIKQAKNNDEIKTFNINFNENKLNYNNKNNQNINNEMICLNKVNYNTKNIYKSKILEKLKLSKINLQPIKIDS